MSFFDHYTPSRSSSPTFFSQHQPSPCPTTSQWYHEQILQDLPPRSAHTSRPGSPLRMHNNFGTQSPKRLSVLGLRSRSNTGNSNFFKNLSPASSMVSFGELPSKRSSHDGSRGAFDFVLPLEKEESRSKSIFSRGNRILRRQGSRFNLADTLTLEGEEEMSNDQVWYGEKEKSKRERSSSNVLQRGRRQRKSDTHAALKSSISEPFHFQHITHTSRGQLPPIELTHPHDLATEFSIIRASQRPNSELKGINAQNLSYRPYTAEDESDWSLDTLAPDAPSLFTRSPPMSPGVSNSALQDTRVLRRTSHSVENFSRPVSRLIRQPLAPTMIPPPRRSSRMATRIDSNRRVNDSVSEILGLNGLSLSPVEDTPIDGLVGYAVSPLLGGNVAGMTEDIGRAFSPDETNIVFSEPIKLTTLNGISEEDSSALRNSHVIAFDPAAYISQPEPETRHESKRPTILLDPLKENRPEYDDLHSPVIPSHLPIHPPSSSGPKSPIEGLFTTNASWEADIDYCYEHAAESNSNFDWNVSSTTNPIDDGKESLGNLRDDSSSFYLHPLDTSKSGQTTPDLQHSSALSASTRTDSEVASPAMFNHSFGVFPPASDSSDTKIRNSDLHILETHFEDESHNSLYPHVVPELDEDEEYQIEEPAYSRTSTLPLSKCNSQESMILSRAASIVRKHRSSTSTNSVPDLVHSPNSSRETVGRDAPTSISGDRPTMPRPSDSLVHSKLLPTGRDVPPRMPFASVSDMETVSIPSVSMHDRSKSASALDSLHCDSTRVTRNRSSTITRGGVRKNRPSYSLFPVAGTPSSRIT